MVLGLFPHLSSDALMGHRPTHAGPGCAFGVLVTLHSRGSLSPHNGPAD